MAETFITPTDVERRRRPVDNQEKIEPRKEEKYYNRGNQVKIIYESEGRFSIPSELYFTDYDIEDVNNISLSRQEDLIETLVHVLNKNKNQDSDCNIGDMLIEEMFETLIGIKMQFSSKDHPHKWMCECQDNIDDENRVINETIIDLSTLKYITIEEGDQLLRKYYRERIEGLSPEAQKEFLKSYGDKETVDSVLSKIKISEPFRYIIQGKEYQFNFIRVGDVYKAQKIVREKYMPKIKAIQNRKDIPGTPLAESKSKKQDEIEKIQEEIAKNIVLYARAMALYKYEGKVLSDQEKVNIYKKIPREDMFDLLDFLENVKFGIQDEREFTCPICGKVDKRLLQRELNPIELLPLDLRTKNTARRTAQLNIYFGV